MPLPTACTEAARRKPSHAAWHTPRPPAIYPPILHVSLASSAAIIFQAFFKFCLNVMLAWPPVFPCLLHASTFLGRSTNGSLRCRHFTVGIVPLVSAAAPLLLFLLCLHVHPAALACRLDRLRACTPPSLLLAVASHFPSCQCNSLLLPLCQAFSTLLHWRPCSTRHPVHATMVLLHHTYLHISVTNQDAPTVGMCSCCHVHAHCLFSVLKDFQSTCLCAACASV